MKQVFQTRRQFIASVAASAAVATFAGSDAIPQTNPADFISQIRDPDIKAGLLAAIERNLLPAASEKLYPGHFTISADGSAYGPDSTWPGLDSWQMAGAYLLLGRTRMVLDYFDFVRASQRQDGNIPWAILPGSTRPDTTWLSGLKYPEGSFIYDPPRREDVPKSALTRKEWVGMFGHWQPKARPLSNLGAVCYILTASEIFDHQKSDAWLRERIASIESAAKYLLSRKTDNNLIAGSGFYTELPPRHGWDGVAQCYIVHAFRQVARLLEAAGDKPAAESWTKHADDLVTAFNKLFWRTDHFAEYVHIERGVVDSHGLSDTNFAAIAFNVATDDQGKVLWPLLTHEPALWAGNVPTQTVAKPSTYEPWELHEKLTFGAPPLKDAAAMGRVWYLDVQACRRMNDVKRLRESVSLVSRAVKDGYWPERFHAPAKPSDPAARVGPEKYCEYPAVLVRAILENPCLFNV